jgi:hypothetical protein
VHGRLVELGERGRRHCRLRERGQPYGRLTEVHGGLVELSGRRRLHRHLAELGGRGRHIVVWRNYTTV